KGLSTLHGFYVLKLYLALLTPTRFPDYHRGWKLDIFHRLLPIYEFRQRLKGFGANLLGGDDHVGNRGSSNRGRWRIAETNQRNVFGNAEGKFFELGDDTDGHQVILNE